MRRSVIILLFLLCINALRIDRDSRSFIDEKGRTVVLHGVNVVVKLPPYLPNTQSFDPMNSLSDEDIEYFKKFGFNLVRFGVLWESIERTPGNFDYTQLNKVEQIVNKLGENGIYVIIDAHQDMFSRILCGEGVPAFYAKNLHYDQTCNTTYLSQLLQSFGACLPLGMFGWRYDADGLPLIEDCKRFPFAGYHLSPELTTIYNSFYNNEDGVIDKFIKFWKVLATKFKNNKYVIGYDIWNEPWPGNLWTNVSSLIPGWATENQILPFYKKVDKALRQVDDDFIFMFEPAPFPDTIPLIGGQVLGHAKDTPASDDKYNNKQVLNVHSYCCAGRADVCAQGEPQASDSDFCNDFHARKMKAHMKNGADLRIPVIFTEFGACSNSENCYQELKNFTQNAEDYLASWAYWMYKPYNDHTTTANPELEGMFNPDGSIQDVKQRALTRTYIQKFQGKPISNKFYPTSATYVASFMYDSEAQGPTVLYHNKDYFYPSGYTLRLFDDDMREIRHTVKITKTNHAGITVNEPRYNLSNQTKLINLSFMRPVKVTSALTYEVKNSPNNFTTIEIVISQVSLIMIEVQTENGNYFSPYLGFAVPLGNDVISKIIVSNNGQPVATLENIYMHSIKINLS
jgi:endoglycosylceramidase